MSGLFSSLGIGAGSVRTQQQALRTTGQNIANVNTRGYSRQRVGLGTNTPNQVGVGLLAGSGVRIDAIQRVHDQHLEAQLVTADGRYGHASGRNMVLGAASGALGALGDDNLRGRLDGFFGAIRELSADAANPGVRRTVVNRAQDLATHIRGLSRGITEARRGADAQLTGEVAQINDLAAEIAELNLRIHESEIAGADANDLRDRRQLALRDLSESVGVQASEDDKGFLQVRFDDGQPLVDGVRSGRLSLVENPNDAEVAAVRLTTPGGQNLDMTAQLGEAGGRVGGILRARDGDLMGLREQLDGVAYEIATRVNAVHANGVDLNGDAGGALFEVGADATNAASLFSVSEAIAADPGLLAAGQAGGPVGDNRNALEMMGLMDSTAGGTRTLGELASDLAGEAGSVQSGAERGLHLAEATRQQAHALRERLSGVSLDEEMIELVKFEKAFNASARVITMVNELLDTVIRL